VCIYSSSSRSSSFGSGSTSNGSGSGSNNIDDGVTLLDAKIYCFTCCLLSSH